jgi:hypothetical protein
MRPPVLDLAHAVVSAKYGPSVARRLFFDNPKCILEGGDVT